LGNDAFSWDFGVVLDDTDGQLGLRNMPVTTVAPGMVQGVVEGYEGGNGACADEPCSNYIHVLHSQGRITSYGHLMPESVPVAVGRGLSGDEIIGLAGETAACEGCYHLHFGMLAPVKSVTIPMAFTNYYRRSRGASDFCHVAIGIPEADEELFWLGTPPNPLGLAACTISTEIVNRFQRVRPATLERRFRSGPR